MASLTVFAEFFNTAQRNTQYTSSSRVPDDHKEAWDTVIKKLDTSKLNTISKIAQASINSALAAMAQNPTNNPWISSVTVKQVHLLPEKEQAQLAVQYGIFSLKSFEKGELIGVYAGKLIPRKALKKGSDMNQYLFDLGKPFENWVIDGREETNFTALINHSKECNLNADMYFNCETNSVEILFKAKKGIKSGQQLTYDYGEEYWEKIGMSSEEATKLLEESNEAPINESTNTQSSKTLASDAYHQTSSAAASTNQPINAQQSSLQLQLTKKTEKFPTDGYEDPANIKTTSQEATKALEESSKAHMDGYTHTQSSKTLASDAHQTSSAATPTNQPINAQQSRSQRSPAEQKQKTTDQKQPQATSAASSISSFDSSFTCASCKQPCSSLTRSYNVSYFIELNGAKNCMSCHKKLASSAKRKKVE